MTAALKLHEPVEPLVRTRTRKHAVAFNRFHARFLRFYRKHGLTNYELAIMAHATQSETNGRNVELRRFGYLKDSGKTRQMKQGQRGSVVWEITKEGLEALKGLKP